MFNKNKNFSLDSQGVTKKTYTDFFKLAYENVTKGVEYSKKRFLEEPEQFDYRTAKAVWLNASIKKFFLKGVIIDNYLRNKIKRIKSHGVDYYLLEGKALVCFKKMDLKSRISGFYSERFKNLMQGRAIHYSKNMLDFLSDMGIHKALPIYFVGHILDQENRLIDVRLVHYTDSRIAYEVSLKDEFEANLFNSNEGYEDEIIVTSKKTKAS